MFWGGLQFEKCLPAFMSHAPKTISKQHAAAVSSVSLHAAIHLLLISLLLNKIDFSNSTPEVEEGVQEGVISSFHCSWIVTTLSNGGRRYNSKLSFCHLVVFIQEHVSVFFVSETDSWCFKEHRRLAQRNQVHCRGNHAGGSEQTFGRTLEIKLYIGSFGPKGKLSSWGFLAWMTLLHHLSATTA